MVKKGMAEDSPESYDYDLNPDAGEGLNVGVEGAHPEKADNVSTAYDIKNLHDKLQSLTNDELKGIPVLPTGSRLEQGATYVDLRERYPQEFTARGDMEADPSNWYVPKTEVDYQLWNHLIGVHNPERLGEADEGASQPEQPFEPHQPPSGHSETF